MECLCGAEPLDPQESPIKRGFSEDLMGLSVKKGIGRTVSLENSPSNTTERISKVPRQQSEGVCSGDVVT